MYIETDVLVIGCGVAGAAAALRIARDSPAQVLVLTQNRAAEESNTNYAQGGIVSRGPDDSAELLAQDVLSAGAECGLPEAVQILAEEGPDLVQRVLVEEAGILFDREPDGSWSFTREGGHSTHRILHVGDATGKAIAQGMLARLNALPNVTLRTGYTAIDLITTSHHVRNPLSRYQPTACLGAYVFDTESSAVYRILARHTILATGGLGRIYRYTTNPENARGDGIAMAHRAGAAVVNAEYVQFHPTTLAIPGTDNFLITEAIRGEGARLYTPDGRHFMEEYAPAWGDLAPRDVVSRAIHHEMVTHGYPHVLLDAAQHLDAGQIIARFPTIHAKCLESGLDITKRPIPVVPAAHYSCGGILVDEWARTNIERLYAAGEVSCTGVHGANRLASTSLLEGLVWGDRAGRDILQSEDTAYYSIDDIPPWEGANGKTGPDPVFIHHDLRNIQNIMWLYVGLSRNAHRLARALRDLNHLRDTIEQFYRTNRLSDELIGLRNMVQTAWIVANSAWRNRHSRGTHFREDARDLDVASLSDMGGFPEDTRAEF